MLDQIKGSIISSKETENAIELKEQRDFEENVKLINDHIVKVENNLTENKF